MSDQRVLFLDLLRVVAAFQMVQGHCLDALLDLSLRHGPVFEGWSFVRGLTSVGFLFAAGLSYYLAALSRPSGLDPARRRGRLKRAGTLILLGYLLRLPVLPLLAGDPAAVAQLAVVDVLQCIGVSLALLELLALGGRRVCVGVCAALAVLLPLAAPLADALVPSGASALLTGYASHRGGSLFPLLPWAGYAAAGVVAGELTLGARRRLSPRWLLAAGGVALLGLWAVLPGWLGAARPEVAPATFLLKLGLVLLVTAGLASLPLARLPDWARKVARHTLPVYVVHVVLLYAQGVGLRALVGPSLGLGAALLSCVALLAACFGLALGWDRLSTPRARLAPVWAARHD